MTNNGTWEIVAGLIADAAGIPAASLSRSDNVFALGVDSLGLLKIGQDVEKHFHVELPLAALAEELSTLGAICEWLQKNQRQIAPATTPAADPATTPAPGRTVEVGEPAPRAPEVGLSDADNRRIALAAKQMEDFLSLSKMQWEAFRRGGGEETHAAEAPPPNLRAFRLEPDNLDVRQRAFVESLVARHAVRTALSKAHTEKYRSRFADWKHTLGFRTDLKQAFYPIIAAEAKGGYFRDVDGNEYLDIALGMGVHYLGHAPDFVTKAVGEALSKGLPLGPQNADAGEAAVLLAELTGMERVAWSNTGSEAIMFALRLARARTGRRKAILFGGSYHGISDGVLAMATPDGSAPASAGVTRGAIESVSILEYGSQASLDEIDKIGDTLAAVLVEPVQSRKPALQPARFLRRLRRLADRHGFALIFDEMITGFRIHSGGAQEWFGVKADIACYGKIIGGGLPVSAVAGSRRFLDGIDGGQWSYQDASLPSAEASGIVYGGTYCRHPLAMAAVKAVMNYFKEQGPALHARTNALAARLCDTLNLFFEREDVPIRVERFASQFRFESFGRYNLLLSPIEMDLFFLLLMEMGIYTWERRICFVSTEHEDRDIDKIIVSVKKAILTLRDNGFPFRTEAEATRRFFPMSPAQLRVFAVMERPGAKMLNHLVAAFEVEDGLDIDRIEEAFCDVVARHEALRTSLHLIEGEAVQKVWAEVPFRLERFTKLSLDGFAEKFLRPFTMEYPPLLRAAFAQLADGRKVLAFDLHHAIADGMSLDIIAREVAERYAGNDLGGAPKPYRDFHADVAGTRHPETTRALAENWRTELALLPPELKFPGQMRAKGGGFEGGKLVVRWDGDRTRAVRSLAQKHGVTVFMFHAAVLGITLRRLTGCEDFYIGTAVGARPQAAEGTVGMFANTLPLRLNPEGSFSVATYMQQVRKNCLATFARQNCPYEIVAEQSPDQTRPLFSVMLPYERVVEERTSLAAGLTFKQIDLPVTSSFYDLNWEVIEEEESVQFKIGYRFQALTHGAVSRFMHLYDGVIDDLSKGGSGKVGELGVLPTEEIAWLETRENPLALSKHPLPETLDFATAWTAAVARERDTDKPAVQTQDGGWTRRELNERAEKLARQLTESGIGSGDRVATLLPPGADLIVAVLAVWRVGGIYIPLDPGHPATHNQGLLSRLAAAAVIEEGGAVLRLDHASTTEDCNETDYVFFTSGSTGEPKAVMGRLKGVMHFLAWENAFLSEALLADGTPLRVAWLSRPAFDASLRDIFLPLIFEGTLFCPDGPTRENPVSLAQWIVEKKISVIHAVPSVFRLLAEAWREGGATAPDLRRVMLAGEALTGEEVMAWRRLAPKAEFVNLYGPTETTMVKTFAVLEGELPAGVLAVGTPLPGSRVYVMENVPGAGVPRRMPRGSWGEVWLAGEGVTRGYFGKPDETAERFVPDPYGAPGEKAYRSGDWGRWRDDGQLEIWGRLDSQVKIHGVRVDPEETRRALLLLPGVTAAAVIAVGNDPAHRELAAYVCGSSTPETIRSGLREILPATLVPKHIVLLSALPLNRTGKIDVSSLPPPGLAACDTDDASITLSETARRIKSIFAEVLDVDAALVSPTASFFALGGHSLNAMRLIGRIHAAFAVSLGMADIFELGSVVAVARRVDQRLSVPSDLPAQSLLAEDMGEAEEVVALTPEERAMLESL